MARVKRGVTTHAKHKRVLEQAKGYYGRRKNTIRIAKQAVEKAGQYAYRDRKVLADIAMHEAEAFSAIVAQAKAALPEGARVAA
jgi:large subunit ribosomal protein L20